MKFKTQFPTPCTIAVWAIFVVSTITTGIAIAVLFGAVVFNITPGQATLWVGVCPILAIVSFCLGTIHYKVENTHLRLYVGPFDLFLGRVRLENILNIVVFQDKLFISYLWQGQDPVISCLMIHKNEHELMKQCLQSKNHKIEYHEEEDETADR